MSALRTIVYVVVLVAGALYIYNTVHVNCYDFFGIVKGCNTVVTKP